MDVYHQYKELNNSSIKERISAFRETAIDWIAKGYSIEKIKEMVEDLENDEMYEAAQGILKAIQDFKKNPQMRISRSKEQLMFSLK